MFVRQFCLVFFSSSHSCVANFCRSSGGNRQYNFRYLLASHWTCETTRFAFLHIYECIGCPWSQSESEIQKQFFFCAKNEKRVKRKEKRRETELKNKLICALKTETEFIDEIPSESLTRTSREIKWINVCECCCIFFCCSFLCCLLHSY